MLYLREVKGPALPIQGAASFTREMAAPTKISTTNHYVHITQQIQTEYFHTHYTSYLTTEKNKQLPFTEPDTQF